MISVRDLLHDHPLAFTLGVALLCCVIALIGVRIHLSHVRSRAESKLQRMRDIENGHIEYQKLEARTRDSVGLLQNPDALTIWGIEEVVKQSTLGGRVTDVVPRFVSHDDLVERLVTVSLNGVHRRELVDNVGPDNPGGFLQLVEAADGGIRTKSLQIIANRANPKLIDVKVTFSAYEPKAASKP